MTRFEFCKMIAYLCDGRGRPINARPWYVNVKNLADFFVDRLGYYGFQDTGAILSPEDWPLVDYPYCIHCGESILGSHGHIVLQWGDARDSVDEPDWAEWQGAFHSPHCLKEFFEEITGGRALKDRMEWEIWRDDIAMPEMSPRFRVY